MEVANVPTTRSRLAVEPTPLVASAEELLRLEQLLQNPPRFDQAGAQSGLTRLEFSQLVYEVQQLAHYNLLHRRPVGSNLINEVVHSALTRRADSLPALANPDEFILAIKESERKVSAGKILGQVERADQSGRTCLNLRWTLDPVPASLAKEKDRAAPVGITAVISAEGRLASLCPLTDRAQAIRRYDELTARNPYPWRLQVPRTSDGLAHWIVTIFGEPEQNGKNRLGFFKSAEGLPGYHSLGVFSEAVATVLEEQRLTHALIPRSRRDPGTKPWHIGTSLELLPDRHQLCWKGYTLDRTGAVVEAQVIVAIEVSHLTTFEVRSPKRTAP